MKPVPEFSKEVAHKILDMTNPVCPRCKRKLRTYNDYMMSYGYCPNCPDMTFDEDGQHVKTI